MHLVRWAYILPIIAGMAMLVVAQETPAPAASPMPVEALRSVETHRLEAAKAAAQYNEAVKTFPNVYRVKLIELQNQLQKSGDLDGYLATGKEIKRFSEALKGEADPFEKVPEMPASALAAKPDSLRTLQDHYLKAYKEAGEKQRRQLEDATNAHIGRLESLQKTLTINNRIREAIIIKQEIDRLRKDMSSDNFVAQTLEALPKGTVATASANDETKFAGHVPEWSKWTFEHNGNFAKEGAIFMHPDLPNELDVDFNNKSGRGRIYGRCEIDRMVVDMRERAWFGKAIQWKISDYATLNAKFNLISKEISPGPESGPCAHLVMLNEKGLTLAAIDVPLWAEATLFVRFDQPTGQGIVGWIQGKMTRSVELPAKGGVRLLFGITVRNPGERCDTTVVME